MVINQAMPSIGAIVSLIRVEHSITQFEPWWRHQIRVLAICAGNLRRHRAHYDVIVTAIQYILKAFSEENTHQR